jgi:hypothetical protein
MARIADVIVIIIGFALLAVLVAYKLYLFIRYKDDPVKREWLIFSTQIYPKKIARFMADANYDEKHPRSAATGSSHKRSPQAH